MPNHLLTQVYNWLNPKDQERNLFSAAFHMTAITLISMSLVGLNWFTISGNACTPFLTISQFFWFGYASEEVDSTEYDCYTSVMVNMMRIIILLCFMAIIFSLGGFFLDIIGPKSHFYRSIRRYAVPSICLVLWIMAIISISYYVVVLLEDSLSKLYPRIDTSVTYGSGFYLIAATGGVGLISIFYTLILMHNAPDSFTNDDTCLIDENYDDRSDFNNLTPPPPYNVPPPPYTP